MPPPSKDVSSYKQPRLLAIPALPPLWRSVSNLPWLQLWALAFYCCICCASAQWPLIAPSYYGNTGYYGGHPGYWYSPWTHFFANTDPLLVMICGIVALVICCFCGFAMVKKITESRNERYYYREEL